MSAIRVLLVEDHTLVRAGIRSLLNSVRDIEVVDETGNGRDGLRLVRKLQPDVVLMDISMPELNGIEATARITKSFPQVKVLMLSMHNDEEYVAQSLKAGARGYLVKEAATKELEQAIHAVMRGEIYVSNTVSMSTVKRLMQDSNSGSALDNLTSRQREILQLVVEGYSTRDIAERLSLSVKTVEAHRTHLMDRLEIRDVPGLVRFAIKAGLIQPGS
ncbi:MAG: response regulator transcription factor [Gammaproteobacteria bacterium]|nr:response regulator transcription factor [Gammaproteobacteria bacterium]